MCVCFLTEQRRGPALSPVLVQPPSFSFSLILTVREARVKREGEVAVRTDAMMMRRPAPFDPPMMETTRLGAMAMQRVIRFLSHVFILMSKNP